MMSEGACPFVPGQVVRVKRSKVELYVKSSTPWVAGGWMIEGATVIGARSISRHSDLLEVALHGDVDDIPGPFPIEDRLFGQVIYERAVALEKDGASVDSWVQLLKQMRDLARLEIELQLPNRR